MPGRPGLVVQQTIDALVHKALLPAPDIRLGQAGAANDLVRAEAVCGRQNNLGSGDVFLSAVAVPDDPLETTAILRA